MFIPEEANRLLQSYNQMSKEEFNIFVTTNEQAIKDIDVTVAWLQKELEPFIETIRGIVDGMAESLQPVIENLMNDQEKFNKLMADNLTVNNNFSLGA